MTSNDLQDVEQHLVEKIASIQKFLDQNQAELENKRMELNRLDTDRQQAMDDLSACEKALTIIQGKAMGPAPKAGFDDSNVPFESSLPVPQRRY
jgi:chromosome segregation ATPase